MYLHVPERVSTLSFVILSIGKLSRVESLSRTGHHYKHPSIRSFLTPVGGPLPSLHGHYAVQPNRPERQLLRTLQPEHKATSRLARDRCDWRRLQGVVVRPHVRANMLSLSLPSYLSLYLSIFMYIYVNIARRAERPLRNGGTTTCACQLGLALSLLSLPASLSLSIFISICIYM